MTKNILIMNKIVDFIKRKWKICLIVLLAVLYVSKCTSSNNYRRKYNKQIIKTEYVIDSMNTLYHDSGKTIDSLTRIITDRDAEILSLNKQLNIYAEQNSLLNDRNKALANKPVIVNIENKKDEE